MKKKLLAIFLASATALSLGACGGSGDSSESAGEISETESDTSESKADSEESDSEDSESEEDSEEEVPEVLKSTILDESKFDQTEDTYSPIE